MHLVLNLFTENTFISVGWYIYPTNQIHILARVLQWTTYMTTTPQITDSCITYYLKPRTEMQVITFLINRVWSIRNLSLRYKQQLILCTCAGTVTETDFEGMAKISRERQLVPSVQRPNSYCHVNEDFTSHLWHCLLHLTSRQLTCWLLYIPKSENHPERKKISEYRGHQEECNYHLKRSSLWCFRRLFCATSWKMYVAINTENSEGK